MSGHGCSSALSTAPNLPLAGLSSAAAAGSILELTLHWVGAQEPEQDCPTDGAKVPPGHETGSSEGGVTN